MSMRQFCVPSLAFVAMLSGGSEALGEPPDREGAIVQRIIPDPQPIPIVFAERGLVEGGRASALEARIRSLDRGDWPAAEAPIIQAVIESASSTHVVAWSAAGELMSADVTGSGEGSAWVASGIWGSQVSAPLFVAGSVGEMPAWVFEDLTTGEVKAATIGSEHPPRLVAVGRLVEVIDTAEGTWIAVAPRVGEPLRWKEIRLNAGGNPHALDVEWGVVVNSAPLPKPIPLESTGRDGGASGELTLKEVALDGRGEFPATSLSRPFLQVAPRLVRPGASEQEPANPAIREDAVSGTELQEGAWLVDAPSGRAVVWESSGSTSEILWSIEAGEAMTQPQVVAEGRLLWCGAADHHLVAVVGNPESATVIRVPLMTTPDPTDPSAVGDPLSLGIPGSVLLAIVVTEGDLFLVTAELSLQTVDVSAGMLNPIPVPIQVVEIAAEPSAATVYISRMPIHPIPVPIQVAAPRLTLVPIRPEPVPTQRHSDAVAAVGAMAPAPPQACTDGTRRVVIRTSERTATAVSLDAFMELTEHVVSNGGCEALLRVE